LNLTDLLKSEQVSSPSGKVVTLEFFADGSVRMQLPGAPWLIKEAVPGDEKQQNAVLRLAPGHSDETQHRLTQGWRHIEPGR
jgi:hypothetical protein